MVKKVRIHGPNPKAPKGSESKLGWIFRVKSGEKYVMPDGVTLSKIPQNKWTHIPVEGNLTTEKWTDMLNEKVRGDFQPQSKSGGFDLFQGSLGREQSGPIATFQGPGSTTEFAELSPSKATFGELLLQAGQEVDASGLISVSSDELKPKLSKAAQAKVIPSPEEFKARIGTSERTGDFMDLAGSSVLDVVARIPKHAKSEFPNQYTWDNENGQSMKVELALPGANRRSEFSRGGWTLRTSVDGVFLKNSGEPHDGKAGSPHVNIPLGQTRELESWRKRFD